MRASALGRMGVQRDAMALHRAALRYASRVPIAFAYASRPVSELRGAINCTPAPVVVGSVTTGAPTKLMGVV